MSRGDLISGTPGQNPPIGWILYDRDCGFCRRSISLWEGVLRRRGFGIAALQEPWVAERVGLTEREMVEDLRLLLADGRHLAGADAYRYAMRRIWWAMPLYGLSVLPGLRGCFDALYRRFARHRHRVSEVCRLE